MQFSRLIILAIASLLPTFTIQGPVPGLSLHSRLQRRDAVSCASSSANRKRALSFAADVQDAIYQLSKRSPETQCGTSGGDGNYCSSISTSGTAAVSYCSSSTSSGTTSISCGEATQRASEVLGTCQTAFQTAEGLFNGNGFSINLGAADGSDADVEDSESGPFSRSMAHFKSKLGLKKHKIPKFDIGNFDLGEFDDY